RGDRTPDREREHAGRVDLLAGRLPQHFGVVFEWHVDVRETAFDVASDVADATPADVRLDVEIPRDRVALDHGRGLRDAHVRDVPEPHVTAVGLVDQQVAHTRRALAGLGRAFHDHLEDLLVLE